MLEPTTLLPEEEAECFLSARSCRLCGRAVILHEWYKWFAKNPHAKAPFLTCPIHQYVRFVDTAAVE